MTATAAIHTTGTRRAGSPSSQPGTRTASNTRLAMTSITLETTEPTKSERIPERPFHKRITRNRHVRNIPEVTRTAAIPYAASIECPRNAHNCRASRLTESRLAHANSHAVTSTSTTNHESAALNAATFTLIATKSSELRGRTATNAGTARSSDQNAGLQNAI